MDAQKIKQAAERIMPQLTEWRRYFHATPEVAWQEVETSKKLESILKEMGFTNVRRGFAGTESGVCADIEGGKGPGKCVALRSDIDALAVKEETGLPFESKNPGAMHACGHDGHIAGLLGAAKILTEMKNEFAGKVRILFQPAEENGRVSGARAMIKEGAIDGVDAIGGLHLWSFVKPGIVQWRVGPAMASSDCWTIKITGKGGHGGMPHAAIDPTVALASMIGAIQTIVSREIKPGEIVIISTAHITAGDGAFNVIPNTAQALGGIRTFDAEIQDSMPERMKRVADGIAAAYRCTAEVKYEKFVPPVINDERLTNILKEAAIEIAGPGMVEESPIQVVSEDYSEYQRKIPGTFFFIGAGCEETNTHYPHHSPKFAIDERALPTAAAVLAGFALKTLEKF